MRRVFLIAPVVPIGLKPTFGDPDLCAKTERMVRWLAYLCGVCVVGAILIAIQPDPWHAAEARAVLDADRLAAQGAKPDQVSLRLSEDAALRRVMILRADGARLYPPPGGMTPLPYAISEDTLRRLAAVLNNADGAIWTRFDPSGTELLHCRAILAICLIYDRAALEVALNLAPDALRTNRSAPVRELLALLLMAVVLMFGGAAVWCAKTRAPEASAAIQIVPERHMAIRGDLEIPLTPRDLKLLALLEDRNGAVATKDELYDAAWGRDYMPNSRASDQHIITLRRKLDPDKTLPVVIETVRGVGYRLVI